MNWNARLPTGTAQVVFFISTRIPLTLILQSSAEEFGFRRCEYAKNFLGKSFLEKGKQ